MPLLLFAAVAIALSSLTLLALHTLHRRRWAKLLAVPDFVPLEWTTGTPPRGRGGLSLGRRDRPT